MGTCPRCGKENHNEVANCSCGQPLTGEGTRRDAWETETVLGTRQVPRMRRSVILSIGFVVAAAILALGWTQLRLSAPGGSASPPVDVASVTDQNLPTQTRTENAIPAKVTAISDGETITVVDGKQVEHQVRLAGIDAPHLNDYFGQQAREYLASLIFNKIVWIEKQKTGDDGMIFAKVLSEGRNINLEQLRSGYARLANDATEVLSSEEMDAFKEGELTARANKIGLWAQTDVGLLTAGPQDGVFAFSSPARSQQPNAKDIVTSGQRAGENFSGFAKPATSFLDQNDTKPTSQSVSNDGAKDQPDCKPEITVALTRPDPSDQTAEVKVVSKPSAGAQNYVLGPRGGCFYVTAGGSKRYVDRSLCSAVSAIGGRQ